MPGRFPMPGRLPMPDGRSIALATLVVPDYDAAIAFYVGALGFALRADEPLERGPDPKRWVVVAPPGEAVGGRPDERGTGLLLARADGERQRARIGDQTGGRVALFLATDDFARDHARMMQAGVRFEEAPRREPYGTVAVWRDPFGNRWDLVEWRRPGP